MIRPSQKGHDVQSSHKIVTTLSGWPGSSLISSPEDENSSGRTMSVVHNEVEEGSNFSGTISANGGSVFQGNVSGRSVNISKSFHLHHKRSKLTSSDIGDPLRKKILDWLSPLSFKDKQADVFSKRRPGTGSWFLDTDKFQSWSQGEKGSTLLCPGIRKISQPAWNMLYHVNQGY